MSLDQPAPIQFLSQEVRGQLRSGIATPSVVQCVEELVVNSIDAGALCIAVRVDLPNCKIQVVDNGRGVAKGDMSFIGERYATSKCRDMQDLENISHYGYRGEALASIKDISSILEINSRARGCDVTYGKLFRHGKDQGISKDTKVRPSGGTTVTAHNVFYNLPVRRKTLCCPLVYEQICKRLQAISLIHPQISLTLRNDSTGVKSIQTHSSSSVVQTFGHLFGKDIANCLKEVNYVRTHYNMSGFIGTTSHRNKSLQFVYVNGRLVLKTRLHKMMNELLGNSLVTRNRGKGQDTMQGTKPNPVTCQPSPGGSQSEYGIFVLNITCPRNEYDITLDPSKTLVEFRDWDGVLTCLQEMVTSFLQQEHLTMKLSPTKISSKTGLEAKNSLSRDDLGCKKTDVCINTISTTDCKNAVQSTSVRRQTTTVLEPDVSLGLSDGHPCDVGTVADSNGKEDLMCDDTPVEITRMSPSVFRGTCKNIDVPEVALPDLTEIPTDQGELNVQAEKEESGTTITNSPVRITPEDKQVNVSPLNVQSNIPDTLCDEEDNRTTTKALLLSSSSELDVCSSEETLSSSEVEIGTPKSDVHQCCDGRCMSLRRDDTDSGQEVIDLVSPRTKLAVKARNSLSMFRRSIKKKRLAKALKDNTSKKSGEKVKAQLQFIPASEHKTIALRWHRSPGFRSRLESLNIKCVERQEKRENLTLGVFHQKLSSHSIANKENVNANDDIKDGNSSKEECQTSLQASSDENTELDLHQKNLHVTEISEIAATVDEHVNSDVGTFGQESNPGEDKEPPVKNLERQSKADARRDGSTQVITEEHCETDREITDGNVENIPKDMIVEPMNTQKRAGDYLTCPVICKEPKKAINHTKTMSPLNVASSEIPRKFLTSNSFMVSPFDAFSNRDELKTSNHGNGCQEENNSSQLEQTSDPSPRDRDELMLALNKVKYEGLLSHYETETFRVQIADDIADDTEILDRKANRDQTLDDNTSHTVMKEGRMTVKEIKQINNEADIIVEDDQDSVKSLNPDLDLNISQESGVEMIMAHEDMDILDTSNADDSISLLYVPHQSEDSLCSKTSSSQELGALREPVHEERNTNTNLQSRYEDMDVTCDADDSISLLYIPQQGEESLCTKTRSCQELGALREPVHEERNANLQCRYEDMDILATCDADDSISLLYIPQQGEESLCTKTSSCQELDENLKEPFNEKRNTEPDLQFAEATATVVASSPPTTITHREGSQLDVTCDLVIAPALSSAIQEKHTNKLSSRANNAQSSRVCEPSSSNQSDKVDDIGSSSARSTDAEFVMESREWYSVYDASRGVKVFINRFTGNCSVNKPEEGQTLNPELVQTSDDTQFSMVTKSDTLAHLHLPHSAASFVSSLRDKRETSSHHPSILELTPGTMATLDAAMEESQEEDDELANIKWGSQRHITGMGDATDRSAQFSRFDQVSTMIEGSSSVDAKFQAKVLSSLNPCQFTKGMFHNIKVLGQVDSKFISCLMNSDHDRNPAGEPNLLVLVDQHAAHERIRLEMLTHDAYKRDDVDDDKTQSIRTSDITPALPVSLSQSELRLMKSYSDKLKKFGIEYTLSTDSAMVTHLPACVVEKEANELKRGRQTIATSMAETLIKEVLDSLEHQSGAVASLPKTITRILNSQACHGAIKFGDTLDISECQSLIGQLSSCDLPFQCAHGRPALMPILDFRKIKLGNSKKVRPSPPQLWKLKYLSLGNSVHV